MENEISIKTDNMDIPIASTVSIRESGFDEYWLQDQIYENPSCLGLGDLESVAKEKQQSSGGRLDILLKNPEDDSMYEVEVMLAETDESHIIRTIEYWDNEKRKWPQRQHYAVLVAESITRKFFNVIHLFSHSIPIIAIQVNIIESNNQKALHFSKILDTYEEPEDGPEEPHDEAYWRKKSTWTLNAANELLALVGEIFESPSLRYLKSYIAINVFGNNYFSFRKRSANKSLLGFRVSDDHVDEVSKLLDEQSISFVQKQNRIKFTVDKDFIKKHSDLLRQIAKFVKETQKK
ncbi:MAG: hypothetical protein KAY65_04695 [Planctomycetes bacterium]|nr:hypothetical protein [Planctomycetota bacterium]